MGKQHERIRTADITHVIRVLCQLSHHAATIGGIKKKTDKTNKSQAMSISQLVTWLLGATLINDSVLHLLQYAGKRYAFVSLLSLCILGFPHFGHSLQ